MLWFLKLIPGVTSLLETFGNLGIRLYDTKLKAEGSHEAKVVELAKRELDLEQREAELQSVAKGQIRGRWYAPENMAFYFIAFPYWFKAITIDNVIGAYLSLHTNPLEGDTAKAMMMIMAFWFGVKAIRGTAETVAGVFANKR